MAYQNIEIKTKEMKKNAIIMVSFDRAQILDLCLESFKKDKTINFSDVIVVDNGSVEDIKSVAKKYKTRYIRKDKNLLIARALNEAFFEKRIFKKYKYVTVSANDVLIEKNTIAELVKKMDGDKKLGMVGPVAHQAESKKFSSAGLSISKVTSALASYTVNADPTGINHFASCFIIRSEVYRKIKGFDDVLFPMVFEEPDLGERILKIGYTIAPCSSAKIFHPIYLEKKRVQEIIKKERIISNNKKAYLFFRNRIIYMRLYSNVAQFILFYFFFNPLLFLYYLPTIPMKLYKSVLMGLADGTVFALTKNRNFIKKRNKIILDI